jgi:tetratricopeptide (TPR) repeat protein
MTEANPAAYRSVVALLLALFAIGAGGCSATPVRGLSQARLQAIGYNQRGVEEQAAGNQDAALAEFSEALRLQSSIENVEGMAVALINIARTQRLKGDLPVARAAIDRAATLLQETSSLAPELYFEKAKIVLAQGDLDAAKDWAMKGALAEQKGDLGRRVNLVGSILLKQDRKAEALTQAGRALQANREAASTVEEANSLRLLGEIHLALGENEEALTSFNGALLLDKDLGQGRKIAADLRGIACASMKKGDLAGAIGYYQRSVEVNRNLGEFDLAAKDMATLSELYRKSGDTRLAAKMEEERVKLLQGEQKLP